MSTPLPWHRRHAIALAAQLPDDPEDGLTILMLTINVVAKFLREPSDESKAVPAPNIVRLVSKDGGGNVAS